MIMYCEKCKKLISQSICPICGNKNIRIPEERDICFLVEKDHIWSGMLEDVLKQNNIPVFVQSNIGAGMAIKAGALFKQRILLLTSCFLLMSMLKIKDRSLRQIVTN